MRINRSYQLRTPPENLVIILIVGGSIALFSYELFLMRVAHHAKRRITRTDTVALIEQHRILLQFFCTRMILLDSALQLLQLQPESDLYWRRCGVLKLVLRMGGVRD